MRSKFLLGLFLAAFFFFLTYKTYAPSDEKIKVGILHSSTGTMAISEQSVIDATMFAIDEINQNGGLLGRELQPVLIDGASSPDTFYAGALSLIKEHKVDVVFGCWTSASRKTVKPLFEENNHLLIYPVQYEGLELSANIFYTGLIPNQQVLPALNWALKHIGKKVYLVGSDYIYPKASNAYIKDLLFSLNIEVLGETYIPLGSTEVKEVVADIRAKKPDLIINTINGDTNFHFFKELDQLGILENSSSVLSFSLTENEYRMFSKIGIKLKGHYTAVGYLFSDEKRRDSDFISRLNQSLGKDLSITDPMISAYLGVNLWAGAVRKTLTSRPEVIKDAILRESFEGPDGISFISREERKLFHRISLGRVDEKGKIQKVWEYDKPIHPVSFPSYRSKKEWETFLEELFREYDQKWER